MGWVRGVLFSRLWLPACQIDNSPLSVNPNFLKREHIHANNFKFHASSKNQWIPWLCRKLIQVLVCNCFGTFFKLTGKRIYGFKPIPWYCIRNQHKILPRVPLRFGDTKCHSPWNTFWIQYDEQARLHVVSQILVENETRESRLQVAQICNLKDMIYMRTEETQSARKLIRAYNREIPSKDQEESCPGSK